MRPSTRRRRSRSPLITAFTASRSLCETEDAAGGWPAIAARTDDIVAAVEGNLETPCTRNARSLLIAAVAQLATGGDADALENRALVLSQRGWSAGALASPGIRLGLLRANRGEVERWLELDVFRMFVYGPGVMAARLDALAALRHATEVEAVAPAYALRGLILEPFAVRALGIVRDDDWSLCTGGRQLRCARPRLAPLADRAVAHTASEVQERRSPLVSLECELDRAGRGAPHTGFPLPRRASRRRSST